MNESPMKTHTADANNKVCKTFTHRFESGPRLQQLTADSGTSKAEQSGQPETVSDANRRTDTETADKTGDKIRENGGQEYSIDRLHRMFNSGTCRGGSAGAGELYVFLTRDCLAIEPITIPVAPVPPSGHPDRVAYNRAADGGGDMHHELKWNACCWLRDLGSHDIRMECNVGFLTADVVAVDLAVVVECGSSRIECIWESLYGHDAFVIMPFHSDVAYRFTRGLNYDSIGWYYEQRMIEAGNTLQAAFDARQAGAA